jgi:UDP-N-acetylglucosamine 2-epimerase (non-hydrolysing)
LKKLKTVSIFGTRPEVIKLAPVIFELDNSPHFESVLVSTGQHREMLEQTMDQFGIVPDYNLDIMKPGQGLSDITIASLHGAEELIAEEKPDLVIVQGDTTTAFAGCLAAFYQKTAVAHVEAGLRTYDKYRPFPEEINRSMITQLADLNFVPTLTAWDSLRREGVGEDKIYITGNTVIDALFHMVKQEYTFLNKDLEDVDLDRRVVVVTSHRRENFGEPIRDICAGIAELAEQHEDIEIVFTVHRNPKVRVPVESMLGNLPRIHLVDPLDYPDMVNLISRSYMVLTDSGGLQEEAPALAKPVLVLRDVTERPEAVQAGMARLIGTSRQAIVASASELLSDPQSYESMAKGASPYGDGKAAQRIIGAIEHANGLRDEMPEPFVSWPTLSITGDQTLIEQPVSDELFYRQLDERIARAKKHRQKVSVATFDLARTDKEHFNLAIKTITHSLRESDTAAALEGKRLVLVLPGAGEEQAQQAAGRLMQQLSEPLNGFNDALSVDIKTYENDEETEDSAAAVR